LVEVIEYLLVFGITVALAGFSVAVFGGSLPTLGHAQGQTEVDQIAGAAQLAAENGTAAVVLPLSNATVSCSDGTMKLTTSGNSYSAAVGAGCSFSFTRLNGLCSLVFTRSAAGIALEVDG
jgi:hypothetical protein